MSFLDYCLRAFDEPSPRTCIQCALHGPLTSCLDWSLKRAIGILLYLAYFLAYLNYANLCRARRTMTSERAVTNSSLQSCSCQCHSCECWQVLQKNFLFLLNVCVKLTLTVLKRWPSCQRVLQNGICSLEEEPKASNSV